MSRDVSGDDTLPTAEAASDAIAPTINESGAQPRASTPGSARPLTVLDSTRYVQGDELGRGGMGRVFAADDLALGRRVAIKELLNATPELIARFERELALTARLQHPGIVTVHDGGAWQTGAPAYVMRLVSGQSLEQKIRATQTLAERIALLPHAIAAVDAIAYAHAQGIIHRDLKPSNVMVGDFGETVVIDWGLAKDLRVDDAPHRPSGPKTPSSHGGATVAGDVIGTPAYMPREQAHGDEVTERADVYALGALLYHLLTGAPPFQGTGEVVLAQVLASTPRPLGEVVPDIPPPLLAIVSRAMALHPEDRYASAAELGTELKRFQAGKLVASHQYTVWELARRWIRRRAAVVAVAAGALIVVAVIGVLSLRRIVREERQTRAALALAETHRTEATQRRADAERLVDLMMFRLYGKLSGVGRLDLLEDVAVAVRDHYAVAGTVGGPEDLRKRAIARDNLAVVLRTKGDVVGAIAEHRAAEEIFTQLTREAPDNSELAADRMSNLIFLAEALGTQADLDAPLPVLRDVEARVNEHLKQHPGAPRWLALRVQVQRELGSLYERRRELGAALASYEASCGAATELAHRAPDGPGEVLMAECHTNVGDVQTSRGEVEAALRSFQHALALDLARRQKDPADAQRLYAVMHSQQKVATALGDLGREREALSMLDSTIAIGEELRRRDPENARWRRLLASAYMSRADVRSRPETANVAIADLRTSVALRVESLSRAPDNVEVQFEVVAAQLRLAMLLEATSQLAEAHKLYQDACSVTDALIDSPGQRGGALRARAQCLAGRGRLATEQKDWSAAVRWHREELASARESASLNGIPRDYWGVLLAHEALADALLAQGDREAARAELAAAREVALQHEDDPPVDPDWKERRLLLEKRLEQLSR